MKAVWKFARTNLTIGEGPVWGVICDDYWTTRDAHVACRQLGYTHAQSGAYALLRSHFGRGTGPILLDNMIVRWK